MSLTIIDHLTRLKDNVQVHNTLLQDAKIRSQQLHDQLQSRKLLNSADEKQFQTLIQSFDIMMNSISQHFGVEVLALGKELVPTTATIGNHEESTQETKSPEPCRDCPETEGATTMEHTTQATQTEER